MHQIMGCNRSVYFLFLLLAVAILLAGCGDRKGLENNAYVIAVGMDQASKKNAVEITFLIANPEYGNQQEGGGNTNEPAAEIISFEANDLSTARNLANTVIAKEISYSLMRTMVVSESFAKDDRFIKWMYDGVRDPDIRRDIRFVVSKEPVLKFLKNTNPRQEMRPHKYFEFMLKRGTETGMIPKSLLNQYFRITEADADAFLAIYGTTERSGQEENNSQEEGYFTADQFRYKGKTNATVFAGSAIFKKGRMIGKLTTEETRVAIKLSNLAKASDILTNFSDPLDDRYNIGVRLRKPEANDIKMNLKHDRPEISVTMPMIADIVSVHSMVGYEKDRHKRDILRKAIENDIEIRARKLIKKTQKKFGAEPFGWSVEARKHFLSIPEYEKFNWMKQYPHMKVNIDVNITLDKFGRQYKTPKIRKERE